MHNEMKVAIAKQASIEVVKTPRPYKNYISIKIVNAGMSMTLNMRDENAHDLFNQLGKVLLAKAEVGALKL